MSKPCYILHIPTGHTIQYESKSKAKARLKYFISFKHCPKAEYIIVEYKHE